MISARKKRFFGFILLVAILFYINPGTAGADTNTQPQKILLLYAATSRDANTFPVLDGLIEYFGHFNVDVEARNIDECTPGMIANYRTVVYLGIKSQQISRTMLHAMRNVKRLIWLEQNIEQYADASRWNEFSSLGIKRQIVSVLYHDQEMPIPATLPMVIENPGPKAEVFAWVSDMTALYPLAWHYDNVWYFGRIDFEEPLSLVFADYLHDALGEDHASSARVLLRIEDVSPSTPPEELDKIIDTMSQYRIPYAVGLIPVAYGMGGADVHLWERPDLVRVLHKVEQTGGSIIMHGYSHQNEFSPQTGEGFEFWNIQSDQPMPNDGQFTRKRLNEALAVCARAGIYPLAFEPPHYAMSKTAYNELVNHFTIYSGQVQMSDRSHEITLTAPFVFRSTRIPGVKVYPENLGYYTTDKPFSVDEILARASRLGVVRDATAGVFFHAYLSPQQLSLVVEGLEDRGYQFIDLRQETYTVQGSQVKIEGKDGFRKVDSSIAINLVSPVKMPMGMVVSLNVLIGILATVLLAFSVIIFIQIRRRNNRLYEE